jgi:hypothetical protein
MQAHLQERMGWFKVVRQGCDEVIDDEVYKVLDSERK